MTIFRMILEVIRYPVGQRLSRMTVVSVGGMEVGMYLQNSEFSRRKRRMKPFHLLKRQVTFPSHTLLFKEFFMYTFFMEDFWYYLKMLRIQFLKMSSVLIALTLTLESWRPMPQYFGEAIFLSPIAVVAHGLVKTSGGRLRRHVRQMSARRHQNLGTTQHCFFSNGFSQRKRNRIERNFLIIYSSNSMLDDKHRNKTPVLSC